MSIQTRSMERTSAERQNQLKILIENLDTLVGTALVEELRNDHENDVNPHIIYGGGNHIPRGATKNIDTNDPAVLAAYVLDSDVIIFQEQHSQAEFAFKLLKHGQFSTNKTFILISNSQTWQSTPLKENNDQLGSNRQSVLDSQDPDLAFLKKYSKYTESDLHLRKIHQFENLKHLEQLIITNDKSNLHAYVVTSGLIYGRGEESLFDLFKTAWMTPEVELPIQGDGNNIIPMIHIQDLATIIGKVIALTPNEHYIFAVDYETMTQKKLVTAIAKGVGNGLVSQVPVTGGVLSMNAWLKPTTIFDSEDQFIDAKKNPIIIWHSKEGFAKNIIKIRNEFKLYRGLDTVKLIFIGPSASGKTFIGKQISEFYKIPLITIKQLITEVATQQSELGELVRTTLQQVRDKMVEEAQAIFDAEKKKKKVPKGQPEPVFDPSYIVPRLPDQVLIKVYKWRLDQNDAQNLGYVLDGFPKTQEQANLLFHDEEQQLIQSFVPKGIVYYEITDDLLKDRSKGLEQSRYTEELLLKRVNAFKKNSEQLVPFLNQFEIKKIKNDEVAIAADIIKEFISRNGPIAVLQDDPVQEANYHEDHHDESQLTIPETKLQEQKSQPQPPKVKKDQLNKSLNDSRLSKQGNNKLTEEQRQEQIRQQERELLDTRSQPLRQYLADNVVPFLTEGLIQICEKQPENPLQFLADFLEAKGNEQQAPYGH